MSALTFTFFRSWIGRIILNFRWVSVFLFLSFIHFFLTCCVYFHLFYLSYICMTYLCFYGSVNKDWHCIIDSHYLFSSIVKSIGECAQVAAATPKKAQPKKQNFKRNPNNKFQKRFNLGGSGLESAKKSV